MVHLPVCRPPFQDESFMGYVLRMANMNNLWGTRWLCQHLGRKSHYHILPNDVERIAALYGVSRDDLARIYISQSAVGRAVAFDAYGHLIRRAPLLRHLRPQICPHCIAETGYARAAWDFSLVCACPFHQTALIDHCPGCDRDISWSRASILMCQCGFEFSKAVGTRVGGTAPEVIVARIVQAKLVDDREVSHQHQDPVSSMLGKLSLDACFRVIWIFGMRQACGVQDGELGIGGKPKLSVALETVRLAYERLLLVHQKDPTLRANAPKELHVPSLVRLAKELSGTEDGYVLAPVIENLRLYARITSLPESSRLRQLELFN